MSVSDFWSFSGLQEVDHLSIYVTQIGMLPYVYFKSVFLFKHYVYSFYLKLT